MNRSVLPLALCVLAACKGSGSSSVGGDGNGDPYNPSGQFAVEGVNVLEGQVWELNRPIRLTFNHPVDPLSINFSTIQIRSQESSAAGHPVTGSFELAENEDGRVVIFRPACPTDSFNSNGAFLPGGLRYEVALPVKGSGGSGTLRDTSGRQLEVGLRRSFVTPRPPAEPLFLDLTPGPVGLASVEFPPGLNLFTQPDPVIEIGFNQSIDGRPENLNTDRIFILYSSGVIGSGSEDVFPATNKLPGSLQLVENCVESGARVNFIISGVVPPNRKLRLQMSSVFRDLVGQTNIEESFWESHVTPTLADLYADPSWVETDETVDEFLEEYDSAKFVDLDAPVPLPFGQLGDGYIAASFDFPGTFTPKNFSVSAPYREIFTDSTQPFTDDEGEQHYLNSGVLNVADFTVNSGCVLRARGKNPLIIYASGEVTINGELNISGNNAKWPTSLNSPQFPEGGAQGEGGGGQGGDTSWVGTAETPRGETGDGPFQLFHAGGQGGEGAYADGVYSYFTDGNYTNEVVAGGGGGGGFARTLNESIYWTKWLLTTEWKPSGADNSGPDQLATRHPQVEALWRPNPSSPIYGAEGGMRGSSADNDTPLEAQSATGGFGIEDRLRDTDAVEDTKSPNNFDTAWTTGSTPAFSYGNPTTGPDAGRAGESVFVNDGNLKNDFWGRRLNTDGTVTVGELLAPWAGAGGGGGGDSCCVNRPNLDGVAGYDPIVNFLPLPTFQLVFAGSNQVGWSAYRKGAGGGGGGGQLQIWAVGRIRMGALGKISANGGIGYSAESVIYGNNGISGSGGGAGGHMVLHTSTGLDLSAYNVGSASNASQFPNLTPVDTVQAFGGRRGWAAPGDAPFLTGGGGDGNGTFMIGRGGAGANGVIQVHVPDPLTDIVWPAAASAGIKAYIGNPVNTDKLEEALALFTAPTAYALIPFSASASMVQSEWIDTGLAGLRLSPDQDIGDWIYPDFASALHKFLGTSTTTGLVSVTNQKVDPQAVVATGSTADVTFASFELTIPGASGLFAARFLRSPELLVGYDVYPKAAGTAAFQIVAATYDRANDTLRISSRITDSPMEFALDPNDPVWSVRQKYFRVETSGLRDSMPSSTSIKLEFQGADEAGPGLNEPGAPFPSAVGWTPNLATLKGFRFIRYRVTFDADAQNTGIDLNSPLPLLDYLKLPFVW